MKYNPQDDVPDNIINGAPANLLERYRNASELLFDETLNKLDNE